MQGIVVGGRMKGARNCGYARMEDIGCAVVYAAGRISMGSELSCAFLVTAQGKQPVWSLKLKEETTTNF